MTNDKAQSEESRGFIEILRLRLRMTNSENGIFRVALIIFTMATVAGLFAAVCLWPSRQEAVFYPMGGIPFRVVVYERSDYQFKGDMNAVKTRVEELEDAFNSYRPQSEISQINRNAALGPVVMSEDMQRIFMEAKRFRDITDGAFDISVGPLIRLWKEAGEKKELPTKNEIKKALASVGFDKVKLAEDGSISYNNGMELGLGGIAKGDIVDQVASLLQQRGVKRGVVAASGDIIAFGKGTFRFGIQDPTAKAGSRVIGEIEINAEAVVTSGNYERFIDIGGRKYSHIIDPRNGWPVDNELVSVTVIGGSCIEADALATGLMVLGRERAIEVLRENPTFKAIFIEKDRDGFAVWVPKALEMQTHFESPWRNWVHHF